MAPITPLRAIVALLTLFGFGSAAIALGAPASAAIMTLPPGIGAGAFLWLGRETRPPEANIGAQPDISPAQPAGDPSLEELMNVLDEPSLYIIGRRVERANAAARQLLGDHIIGEDVRLAIRHPAAAERLIGERASEAPRTAIELVGVGDRERPWELIVHELGHDSRFVRLADRSNLHTAEKMRVDFVANASHELRTPLTSLLGYVETLQDGVVEDEQTRAHFLEIMHSEANRMQQLIEDLMSLSRIEAERFRAPDEEIDLAALIDEAVRGTCSAAGEELARVAIENDTAIATIPGDQGQLAQLVSNLVGNALKYSRTGSLVTVRTQILSDDMVRLSIEDRGDGIAAEHLPRLTERFYRIDPGRSRKLGGTGLGLAIVKHIVERHRGRLDIQSIEGEGTRVIVDLPKNQGRLSSSRNENATGAGADAG